MLVSDGRWGLVLREIRGARERPNTLSVSLSLA